MATYEELRQRHNLRHNELLGALLPHIDWSRQQIQAERDAGLRAIVRHAKEHSPWHADRLSHVDPESLSEQHLTSLPVMTKDDLMGNWNAIVTDTRLTLDRCDEHLRDLESDAYLLDEFHVVASGGSSGARGVFAYDWQSWATCSAAFIRWVMRSAARLPELQAAGIVVAIVAAQKATHMTSALTQTFSNPMIPVHRFPVTLPIREIIDGLNAVQPTVIQGYPSMMYELARAAQRGDLRIAPRVVSTSSEALLPEIRSLLEEVWNAPISNWWGTSEGGANGISCGLGTGMHLSDDLLIIEPVDAEGRPVPAGVASSKIYLTNLYNPLLPLIRYEITDEITLRDEGCECGSSLTLIDDILGRADDCFVYRDAVVHPHVFRSPLSREPSVIEYQVRQTEAGARVLVRCSGALDEPALARTIAHHLRDVGVPDPQIDITRVESIERSSAGKLKRFVPLAANATVVA